MSKRRPNIGVTGPDEGGRAAWWFTRFAVFIHGGRAIHIRPQDGLPEEEIEGLIIGGGADINPQRYGSSEIGNLFSKDEKISGVRQLLNYIATILFFPFIYFLRKLFSTTSMAVDNARDNLEFELLNQATKKGIPILGICRGAQLINIHFGGTLHQSIGSFYSEVPQVNTVWPKKKVYIDQGSNLFDVLQFEKIWVNALHNQAVDELGKKIKIVAREENGVVQAIEQEGNSFIIGVQWHPEYMPQIPAQRRIFKKLVEKAKELISD